MYKQPRQNQTTDETLILRSQLSKFGLNPVDWNVVKSRGNLYRAISTTDKNFQLEGFAHSEKSKLPVWTFIRLASL